MFESAGKSELPQFPVDQPTAWSNAHKCGTAVSQLSSPPCFFPSHFMFFSTRRSQDTNVKHQPAGGNSCSIPNWFPRSRDVLGHTHRPSRRRSRTSGVSTRSAGWFCRCPPGERGQGMVGWSALRTVSQSFSSSSSSSVSSSSVGQNFESFESIMTMMITIITTLFKIIQWLKSLQFPHQ